MSVEWYPTGNSYTNIGYDRNWLVLDLGGGHNPHPRSNVIVDKFIFDDGKAGRSGRPVSFVDRKNFIVADGCALPFKNKQFDFVICSHVLEHIENVTDFCTELNRIGQRGYIETPSKFSEILKHPPYHLWYVTNKQGKLEFESAPPKYPLGLFGKMFFSIYFYKGIQLQGKDVFTFSYGVPTPFDQMFLLIRKFLVYFWLTFKGLTYTRLSWKNNFSWEIKTDDL